MGSDTQEKINFLKKSDFSKMLQFIDEDQLLEAYGGKLKLPNRIWPPVDSYTPEKRASVLPVNERETRDNLYEYKPGVNEPIHKIHAETSDDPNLEDSKDEELNEPHPKMPYQQMIAFDGTQKIQRVQSQKKKSGSINHQNDVKVGLKPVDSEKMHVPASPTINHLLSANQTGSDQGYTNLQTPTISAQTAKSSPGSGVAVPPADGEKQGLHTPDKNHNNEGIMRANSKHKPTGFPKEKDKPCCQSCTLI